MSTKTQNYKYRLSGNTYLSSFFAYADGSVLCTGDLSTNYSTSSTFTVRGNLYVEGNFVPQCPLHVTGNVYVGGNFTTTWNMPVYVAGSLYVGGNTDFQGTTTVGNSFFCGGNVNFFNGNGTNYKFYSVKCLGDLNSQSAWGAKINISNSTFVYGKMILGAGDNTINGSIYVMGHGYGSDDDVCNLNGGLHLYGDVWCGGEYCPSAATATV